MDEETKLFLKKLHKYTLSLVEPKQKEPEKEDTRTEHQKSVIKAIQEFNSCSAGIADIAKLVTAILNDGLDYAAEIATRNKHNRNDVYHKTNNGYVPVAGMVVRTSTNKLGILYNIDKGYKNYPLVLLETCGGSSQVVMTRLITVTDPDEIKKLFERYKSSIEVFGRNLPQTFIEAMNKEMSK